MLSVLQCSADLETTECTIGDCMCKNKVWVADESCTEGGSILPKGEPRKALTTQPGGRKGKCRLYKQH